MIIYRFPESPLESFIFPFSHGSLPGHKAQWAVSGSLFSVTYLFRGGGDFTSVGGQGQPVCFLLRSWTLPACKRDTLS